MTSRHPCAECGRRVLHTADGVPAPHMRPVPGGIRCPASPDRPRGRAGRR